MSIIRNKDVGEQLKKKFEKELQLYSKHIDEIGTEWKNNIIKISSLPVRNIEFLVLTFVYNYVYYQRNIFNLSMTDEEKEREIARIISTPINENIVMMLINELIPQLSQKKKDKNPYHRIDKNDFEKKKLLAHIATYTNLIIRAI